MCWNHRIFRFIGGQEVSEPNADHAPGAAASSKEPGETAFLDAATGKELGAAIIDQIPYGAAFSTACQAKTKQLKPEGWSGLSW